MSASYFKLKMIKKQNSRCKQTKPERNPVINLDKSYTYHQCCRICLNKGFIPIFGDRLTFDLPQAIRTFGGIEVREDDSYPKHLCEECHSLLNGAVIFRKSAKDSDGILRRTSNICTDTPALSDNEFSSELDTSNDLESDVKEYECKACQITFKSLDEYSHHIKTHKKIRIQCKICMKLLTRQLYKKHLARHQSASHLVCEVCGKLYRKDNLLRHLQLHSNELPYQCSECPYRGRFMESLKIHSRTHSGNKPFACEKCELKFITKSNLNRHLLTHDKERQYKCVECNRGFYTQRDMDVHLRADHAGFKDFCCRICGNKYGTKKSLMRHELRVHKREKMAKGRMPLYLQSAFQNNQELISDLC